MAWLDTYRAMLEGYGRTQRDRNINILKHDYTRHASANPAYKKITVGGNDMYVIINSQDDYKIKEFVTMPGERVPFGSIVMFRDMPWLTTDIDIDDEVYSKGKMYLCNCALKWRGKNGEIYSYDGVAEDATKYSEGVEGTQYISIGEFQLKVKVQVDEVSSTIWRGMRFIIDVDKYLKNIVGDVKQRPYVYRVTRRNIVTGTYANEGYVEITLVEDQWIEGKDDFEKMLAAQPDELRGPFYDIGCAPDSDDDNQNDKETDDNDDGQIEDSVGKSKPQNGGWM